MGKKAATSRASAGIAPSQQHLCRLTITKLKSLRDVLIDFEGKHLTAVMGTNCSGKTTVLHALACAYRPLDQGGPDYRFPRFFKPNTDSLWQGSAFSIVYDERRGPQTHKQRVQRYAKAQDRWTPRYERRPARFTQYVTIRECVPEVELVPINSMIHYSKAAMPGAHSDRIRMIAGQVLNRVYDEFHEITYQRGKRRSIGVTADGDSYSALSMSSGEQRVFRILDVVFNSPRYSLLLIDEIDLFLHQDALERLLRILQEHCKRKGKQIVFTTHFPPMASLHENVSVITLHQTPDKTVIWMGYSYEALRNITGVADRPIRIHVEDDVAAAIVGRAASDMRIRRYVDVSHFGPASNAFALGAGLVLSNSNVDNTLIVLDGDVMASRVERRDRVKRVLTGDQPKHNEQRDLLGRIIRPLKPGRGGAPEQCLHRFLQNVRTDGLSEDEVELLAIAQGIVNVPDRHGFVNEIIAQSGESREVTLSNLVRIASRAEGWSGYVRLVRYWLSKRRSALGL